MIKTIMFSLALGVTSGFLLWELAEYLTHLIMYNNQQKESKKGFIFYKSFVKKFECFIWYTFVNEEAINVTWIGKISSLFNHLQDVQLHASLIKFREGYYRLDPLTYFLVRRYVKGWVKKNNPTKEEFLFNYNVPSSWCHKGACVMVKVDRDGNQYNDLGEKLN